VKLDQFLASIDSISEKIIFSFVLTSRVKKGSSSHWRTEWQRNIIVIIRIIPSGKPHLWRGKKKKLCSALMDI